MPRADLPVVTTVDTGIDPAASAVAASASGHQFSDNGKRALFIANSDASSHTVEVLVPVTVEGLTVGPQVITVAAGASVLAGILTGSYRQSDGKVYVDVPVQTGMTLVCVEVR